MLKDQNFQETLQIQFFVDLSFITNLNNGKISFNWNVLSLLHVMRKHPIYSLVQIWLLRDHPAWRYDLLTDKQLDALNHAFYRIVEYDDKWLDYADLVHSLTLVRFRKSYKKDITDYGPAEIILQGICQLCENPPLDLSRSNCKDYLTQWIAN